MDDFNKQGGEGTGVNHITASHTTAGDGTHQTATTLQQSDYAAMIKDLTEQKQTQSNNLIEQREIIKNKDAANKELEQKLEAIETRLQQLSTQTVQTELNPEYQQKLETLSSFVEQTKKREQEQKISQVLSTFQELSIPKEQVKEVIEYGKLTFGVDLISNPNTNLAQTIARNFREPTGEPHLPSGSFSQQQHQGNDISRQAIDAMANEGIQRTLQELNEYKNRPKK